ncbi:type II secretion system protein [uncultured Campylobacter sp.]|uniref:prepilin-type N-terminal cleavage/methylation domain-containing protein n=1 Tax=uncultured Campylobacter sp. TaxID=218934 RepID=UPI0025E4549E|nr:type II secretion system protein [uncultured Campylobacter sp.]
MKRGFTLIELVFVIVVLGIISMFGADLYTKIYKSYVHVRAVNQLEARTQNAMMLITNRLEDRIKSSTIGRDLAVNDFVPISDLTNPRFDILEWIGQSVETRNINQRNPGWSGFMSMSQLRDSTWTADTNNAGYIADTRAAFNMVSLGSNFPQVARIVGNLRATTYNRPSTNTQVAVIFRVVTNDASPTSVNIGFGYDGRVEDDGSNRVLIAVGTPSNAGSGSIQGETIAINQYPFNPNNANSQEFSEQYYIAHSAYAIVPANVVTYTKDNAGNLSKNFDLVLKYNYRPWSTVAGDAHSYNNNNTGSALLAEDVSLFRFKDDNGAVALKLCMRDDGRNFDPSELDLNVCKAQVVY